MRIIDVEFFYFFEIKERLQCLLELEVWLGLAMYRATPSLCSLFPSGEADFGHFRDGQDYVSLEILHELAHPVSFAFLRVSGFQSPDVRRSWADGGV